MRACVHFVGFRGEEYNRAQRVWGTPDFVHVSHDVRVAGDVALGDTVVFANGSEAKVVMHTHDDSQHF